MRAMDTASTGWGGLRNTVCMQRIKVSCWGKNVPTFTDLDGRLMALKPDVTLSIAKNTKADKNTCEKVYYLESVYRESKESHTYKEISRWDWSAWAAWMTA